jgi:hypothetical protein
LITRRIAGLLSLALFLCVGSAAAQDQPTPEAAPQESWTHFTYKLGVDYMFQASGRRDYAIRDETFQDDETFAWWRLRPHMTAKSRHLDVILEGQDTHAAGGSFSSRKAWLDLLNAFADVKAGKGVSLRIGRQQADFEVLGRMVRTSDFAAVIRSFDVVQANWRNKTTDLRASLLKPVDSLPSTFNRQKKGERLWTVYGRRVIAPRTAIQSYVIARHNDAAPSETGINGRADVYAWLFEIDGPTPSRRVTWTVETVLERGRYSSDDVKAHALFLRTDVDLSHGYTVDARYNVTSGDDAKGDGVRGQFDTFYAAANVYGALGLFRGSNLRSFNIGGTVPMAKTVTFNWRYWNNHLNSRNDVWYGAVGPNIVNPTPTSLFAGHEILSVLSWQATPKTLVRTGYFQFFPGRYAQAAQGNPYELRLQIIGAL